MNDITFTKKYDNFDGRIITQEKIQYNDKCISVTALWDTGSTYTCISEKLIEKLSIDSNSNSDFVYTSYGKIKSKTYDIIVILNDQLEIPVDASKHNHIHEEGVDLLIGMDIIFRGDFAISTYNEETCFSFRYPSKGHIDFTKDF